MQRKITCKWDGENWGRATKFFIIQLNFFIPIYLKYKYKYIINRTQI